MTAGSDILWTFAAIAGSDCIGRIALFRGCDDFISIAICRRIIGAISINSRIFNVTGASRIVSVLNLS